MPLHILPEVRAALLNGRPVVALETAVLTHGLPKAAGLEAIRRQSAAVSAAGAWPAVVAVWDRALTVGLSLEQCRLLADTREAAKVSVWNLAAASEAPGAGGTTVAATVRAAALSGIAVVSTGGIGGVHPGGHDVSADLEEIARRPVSVVCAGPKSILDVAATVERLESLGVPVYGLGCDRVPGFLTQPTAVPVTRRVDSVPELAALIRDHRALSGGGVLVMQAIAEGAALPQADMDRAIRGLEGTVGGAARTPAELAAIQARLGPRAVDANLLLLEANARLAGELAAQLRTV